MPMESPHKVSCTSVHVFACACSVCIFLPIACEHNNLFTIQHVYMQIPSLVQLPRMIAHMPFTQSLPLLKKTLLRR